jgi:HSP20 family protein
MNMILRDHFLNSFFSTFERSQNDDSEYEVYENESSFHIDIELPGLKKEQLSVKVHENHLKVNANENSINSKNDNKRRRTKRFSKTFKVPSNVDQAKISSSLEDGILTLILPKFEKETPRVIDIDIK